LAEKIISGIQIEFSLFKVSFFCRFFFFLPKTGFKCAFSLIFLMPVNISAKISLGYNLNFWNWSYIKKVIIGMRPLLPFLQDRMLVHLLAPCCLVPRLPCRLGRGILKLSYPIILFCQKQASKAASQQGNKVKKSALT
jgi:hypothetical protein